MRKFQESLPYFEECLQIQVEKGVDPKEIENTREWITATENNISSQ